jgi:hypothetical protein
VHCTAALNEFVVSDRLPAVLEYSRSAVDSDADDVALSVQVVSFRMGPYRATSASVILTKLHLPRRRSSSSCDYHVSSLLPHQTPPRWTPLPPSGTARRLTAPPPPIHRPLPNPQILISTTGAVTIAGANPTAVMPTSPFLPHVSKSELSSSRRRVLRVMMRRKGDGGAYR